MKKILILILSCGGIFFFFLIRDGNLVSKNHFYNLLSFKFHFILNDDILGKEKKEAPIGMLKISKIDFDGNIYSIGSIYNQVDQNVELLEASNIFQNLFFIAGHSGYSWNSYFNDLSLLDYGDVVELVIYDKSLVYVIDDIYFIEKTGVMDVEYYENTLFLVTCSLIYPDKQLVVKGSLLNL